MDILLTETWSKNEITSLNKTRMFLQIFWISDITDPHHNSILHYLLFEHDNAPSFSFLKWPPQDEPDTKARRLWKRELKTILLPYIRTLSLPRQWFPLHLHTRVWRQYVSTTKNNEFCILTQQGIFRSEREQRTTITLSSHPINDEINIPHVPMEPIACTSTTMKYSGINIVTIDTLPPQRDNHVEVAMSDGSEKFGVKSYGEVTGNYESTGNINIEERFKGRA